MESILACFEEETSTRSQERIFFAFLTSPTYDFKLLFITKRETLLKVYSFNFITKYLMEKLQALSNGEEDEKKHDTRIGIRIPAATPPHTHTDPNKRMQIPTSVLTGIYALTGSHYHS